MENFNYHALFYYRVLSRMQNLRGEGGVPLGDQYSPEAQVPEFSFGYEPRVREFRYQYQREKFLASRDKLVAGYHKGSRVVFIKESNDGNHVTIYRDAVLFLFDKDERAFEELNKLLSKFYDVTIEGKDEEHRNIDLSDSRSGSHLEVTHGY